MELRYPPRSFHLLMVVLAMMPYRIVYTSVFESSLVSSLLWKPFLVKNWTFVFPSVISHIASLWWVYISGQYIFALSCSWLFTCPSFHISQEQVYFLLHSTVSRTILSTQRMWVSIWWIELIYLKTSIMLFPNLFISSCLNLGSLYKVCIIELKLSWYFTSDEMWEIR